MDFIANIMENTTVTKSWKSVNICQTYERMYSCTVFIETQCIQHQTAITELITSHLLIHTHCNVKKK